MGVIFQCWEMNPKRDFSFGVSGLGFQFWEMNPKWDLGSGLTLWKEALGSCYSSPVGKNTIVCKHGSLW